ncbi:ABC transporter permease [Cohnella sp. CIP 111063]|uniref:carbohydrate ABC transporter permease n=1 Tax=unclassified Cohnella TaxID=2636738 RepID=UPI000B8C62B0|nr:MULTISPECIES: sugar ABC transporter permease [unclassified Cohnella]OXS52599.1 ABC transporter permease [Cohnella sp. CIP 111063]PRX58861.1 multiple sugar transport system permease protein/oligogalacturonide transport system permease protein [Cohnella sp. SGD-V74]
MGKTWKRHLEGYLFIGPWFIGFLVFMLIPAGWSLYLAFTDFSFLKPPVWTGTENVRKMLDSDVFWKSLRITSVYALLSVPLHLGTALLAAMALNVKIRGIGFYRTVFYLPAFVSSSIGVAIMWKMIFSDSGVVNALLTGIGLDRVKFFNSPDNALYTLVGINAWVLGTAMLIFLAGLQQIPRELYESAKVDGAGAVRRFRSITLPLLTPVILFNLILGIINAMQVFTNGFVITRGGPAQSTYFYVLYLYEEAFKFFRMGYASLLAWVLFLIVLLLTLLTLRSSSAWVFYETEMKGGKR